MIYRYSWFACAATQTRQLTRQRPNGNSRSSSHAATHAAALTRQLMRAAGQRSGVRLARATCGGGTAERLPNRAFEIDAAVTVGAAAAWAAAGGLYEAPLGCACDHTGSWIPWGSRDCMVRDLWGIQLESSLTRLGLWRLGLCAWGGLSHLRCGARRGAYGAPDATAAR